MSHRLLWLIYMSHFSRFNSPGANKTSLISVGEVEVEAVEAEGRKSPLPLLDANSKQRRKGWRQGKIRQRKVSGLYY